ncbi:MULTISPECIES: cysteine synthase A [unclassified Candidatus Frackibacter]|uniref:cysteine synthase A n=1 Tax=unclassified Candidatus Frackibacter TaxID=2648818 RepID=UPI00088EA4E8|nr:MULTISPECIES: cysteine synthase A [unclassified Candidatus Frackibacter]SDC48290.1 cysteine synthase [Candidatus Frackibacter sp. WG11]SEM95537.1 cysteine synthase [Candidatus Frackibacter sp. WG12]SFL73448.1 cysteine synthase [Candidatus Frackibacter sp. WG13]
MKISNNIVDLIGNTPIVKLNHIVPPNAANVYVKLESFNPTRSVKARPALNMIEVAEKNGTLKSNGTIIEPTSGNTGIGLAMVAAVKGYPAILVMPEDASEERIKLMKAYGADVVLTSADEGMSGAVNKAEELLKEIDNSFMPNQFQNLANPDAHRHTTAKEILEIFDDNLDIFVSTAGTGGTVSGTGEVLKHELPNLKIYIVESENSPVISGGEAGSHQIPGTGPGFIPDTLNTNIYDRIYRIVDENALETARQLAIQEGILIGPSAGAAIHTALQAAKEVGAGKNILAMAPDTGERYLSTGVFKNNS